jgi:hypothetical protein
VSIVPFLVFEAEVGKHVSKGLSSLLDVVIYRFAIEPQD